MGGDTTEESGRRHESLSREEEIELREWRQSLEYVIRRGDRVLKTVALERCLPHNYALWVEFDGNDAWVGTSKGLGRALGDGYYPALKEVSGED